MFNWLFPLITKNRLNMGYLFFLIFSLISIFGNALKLTTTEKTDCPFDSPNKLSYIDPKSIDVVSYLGDYTNQYYSSLRDLNFDMRKKYKEMITKIGQNTFPLIIATESVAKLSSVGATYTLFLQDGSIQHISPTGLHYEMYKSLAHIEIALFTILSPYFNNTQSLSWMNELILYEKMVDKVYDALQLIEITNCINDKYLTTIEKLHGQKMIEIVKMYISKCIEKKITNLEDFLIFTNEIYPYIKKSIKIAGKLQVYNTIPALQKWKYELGDDTWNNIYVVIPTVWGVSEKSTRLQIFEEVLDIERISTNIIIAEGAKNIDEARNILGRVLLDRSMADIIFGRHTKERKEFFTSLSGRRDLLEKACNSSIIEFFDRLNVDDYGILYTS